MGISARRGGAVHTDAEEEPRGWPPPNGARRWHSPRWSGGRAERATDRGKKIRRTAQRTAATVEAVRQEPWWPIHEPHAAAARSCIDIVICGGAAAACNWKTEEDQMHGGPSVSISVSKGASKRGAD